MANNSSLSPAELDWLTVCKASAGSGKTFTLAVRYIDLLVRQPDNFRNILAVTFTNKATGEMKLRILGQLYGIWKGLDDSKAYLDAVQHDTGLDTATLRGNCGAALHLILHSYSYFKVQTIDAFFQQVLRNLQHEMELNANLRVSLEDKLVMSQAVDDIVDSLNDRAPELGWIMEYIREKIGEDKSWNVISPIKAFGENIFRDFYKENAKALNELDDKTIPNNKSQMRKLMDDSKTALQRLGQRFFDLLDRQGITVAMLSNGTRGAAGYFLKLRDFKKDCLDTAKIFNATAQKTCDDPTKWVKKADLKKGLIPMDTLSAMSEMITAAEEERLRLVRTYKSANASSAYLYQLRLLKKISDQVHQNNRDTFQYQLSDTQTLIHRLIDQSDAPFIYEKIGSRLEHIMIDEFQDTGTIQWQNFKVLLQDCISQHRGSLIVGDVKQSIYRWRGGDWQILNAFGKHIDPSRFSELTLDVNRRSAKNIVQFNNAFFSLAPAHAYDNPGDEERNRQLRDAYAEAEQGISPKYEHSTGLVDIQLFDKNAPADDILSATAKVVQQLLDSGARPGDIGIITRGNGEIQDIANYFQAKLPEVPLVSDEAFKLSSSLAVNIIIDALRVMTDESNTLARASLTKAWLQQVRSDSEATLKMVLAEGDFDTLLPQGFSYANRKRLLARPIPDIVEELYNCFGLDSLQGQGAYVCTFFDLVTETVGNGCTSVRAFLEEWDNKLSSHSIESDDVNGIRLLTIHKSKGLEFNHVILPFCNWELEKGNIIWCGKKQAPFDQLPIVPVSFSKTNMAGTVYEEDYAEEHFQNIVDNLNLLYVAFTRPRHNLFVIGHLSTDGNHRSKLIGELLPEVEERLHQLPDADRNCTLETDEESGAMHFSYGSLLMAKAREKQQAENIFEMESQPLEVSIASFPDTAGFRQSNASMEFITGDDEQKRQRQYMLTGSVLHSLLSRIHTTDDIEPELARMERMGIVYDRTLSRADLLPLLRKRLQSPQARDWFSPRWTVFNECSILSVNPDTDRVEKRRPDRVITNGEETLVIDFKFARQSEDHKRQVRQYMSLLSGMGMPGVKGFLWYVYPNIILPL